jgi:hypothetical protein
MAPHGATIGTETCRAFSAPGIKPACARDLLTLLLLTGP